GEPNADGKPRKTPSILILSPLLVNPASRIIIEPLEEATSTHARRAGNARKRQTAAGFALALAVSLLSTACGSSGGRPLTALSLLTASGPRGTSASSAAGTGPPPTSFDACVVVTEDVCAIDAIPFASPGGVQLAVDVYKVDGESNRPAVVLLGPGGWGASSRDTVSGLAIALAQQGLVVFVGDVRLACTDGGPLCGYRYPAPVA